jgi:hypothetical protein
MHGMKGHTMKNVLEEVLLEPIVQDEQVTIHDSVELEKELQIWIQQFLKIILSEI